MAYQFDPVVPEETPNYPYDVTASVSPVQGDIARNRAMKLHIALGDKSPGVDSILNEITLGNEDIFRQQAAVEIAKSKQQENLNNVLRLASLPNVSPQEAYKATIEARKAPMVDPQVAPEQSFAEKYVKKLAAYDPSPDSIVARASVEDPQSTQETLRGAEKVAARTEIARKGYEDAEAALKAQSFLGHAKDFAKDFIPGMHGLELSPDYNPLNIMLTGSSLEAEREKFWAFEDLSEAKRWLDSRVAAIAKENPGAAVQFAKAMINFPIGQKVAGNLFGALDVPNVATGAAAVTKGAILGLGLKRLLKAGVVDGIGPAGEVSSERTAAALGDIKTGSDIRSARQIFQSMDPAGVGHEVFDQMHTVIRPDLIVGPSPTDLLRERTSRIVPTLKQDAQGLALALEKAPRAPRTPEETLAPQLAHADEVVREQYPSINHGVLDVRRFQEGASNTNFAEVVVGTPEGLLFKSWQQAQNFAERKYELPHGSFHLSNEPPVHLAVAEDAAVVARNTLKFKPPLYNGTMNAEQVTNALALNKQNLANIRKTLSDPIEARRDPAKYQHLMNQMPSLEKEIDAQTKFLATKKISPAQEKLNSVMQQGNRWYISIIKPFDETHGLTARSLLTTTNNTNPVAKGLGGWFFQAIGARSAEDQLSIFGRGNRHLVTHVPQEIMSVFKDMAVRLRGSLSDKEHKDLAVILNRNKDYVEYLPTGETVRGRAYGNQPQLDKEWLDAHGVLPTQAQSLAYWNYHQLMQIDWAIRNFGVHRDLARQGTEQFAVNIGEKTVNFPGRFQSEFPWESPEGIGFVINDGSSVKHYWKNQLSPEDRARLKERIANKELKVLQVGNLRDRPFSIEGVDINLTTHFLLTNNFESKPLSMRLVDYNPGVHIVYPQEHWVKQAITAIGEKGLLHYYGDKVLFAADSEAEAKRISAAVNTVGKMIKDGKTDTELNDFIYKNLNDDAAYWRDKFKNFLDIDQPVGNTYSGNSFYQHHPQLKPDGLTDVGKSSFNMYRSIDMDFLANRNGPIDTLTKTGKAAGGPMYTLEKARTLDPFESLSRGLNNGVRALINNDTKISAIEQWAAQYAYLAENPEIARNNPWSFFYNYIKLNKNVDGEEARKALTGANATRDRILAFVGTNSEVGRDLNVVQQRLINKMSNGLAVYYNDHELKFLKDPLAFTRSVMTHFRFGFFNPAQFVVQGMGAAHAVFVAGPINGMKAMAAYPIMLAMYKTENPAVLNRLASIGKAFGWNKEELLESFATMRRTGLDIIGKEHTLRNDSFDVGLFDKDLFAKWSLKPFTEGERLTRMVAWNAAFLEFKKANPGKAIGQYELPRILTRADDLSSNMTKASHSALQEGLFAVPTQFYTFSHRMMEQFWGGRLTRMEKLRAFLGHGALFGFPVALSIGIPWPVADSLKQELLEQGSPLLNNGWYKAATEGWLSYVASHVLPLDKEGQKREYNIPGRYGPGFSDAIKKLIENETTFAEFATGATGTFLKNAWKSTYPFRAHLYIGALGGQEELPLRKEDAMGLVREISSANNYYNAWMATNTGNYFAKNGEWVAKGLDSIDAAAMVLSLTRTSITDARLVLGGIKEQAAAQAYVQTFAEREFKRAFQAAADNDWKKAEAHLVRAKAVMVVMGDFKDDMIAATVKKASSENQPMVDRLVKDFTEKGYKSQLPARLQRLFELGKSK